MKFLVFALCVSAAYAATFPGAARTAANVAASPFVAAASSLAAGGSAVARAASGSDADAAVLRSESDVQPDGFNYVYETGNGISAQAHGTLKNVDNQDVIGVQGEYAYVAPDGTNVKVSYVADENGYQPQSDQLPVPPPIPPAIARALEWIAAHPPPVEQKKF